ncbi:HTH-type transcriptional activator Btr [compost metagenome]
MNISKALPLGGSAQQITATYYSLLEDRVLKASKRSLYSKWVLKAMEDVNNHYPDPDLSLETVAERLQISGIHLRTTFKKETGQSLLDYTTEYRIEAAKRLLAETDLKIYEIAERVGYKTSQYFSQVFKRCTGFQPKDYMQREGRD